MASRPQVGRNSVTAGLTLTISLLVSQALPLTLLELTGFDEKANSLNTWYDISPSGAHKPSNGAPWFYYTNSMPGFIPYLEYGLITLWAIATALFYGLRIHGASVQPEAMQPPSGMSSAWLVYWREPITSGSP